MQEGGHSLSPVRLRQMQTGSLWLVSKSELRHDPEFVFVAGPMHFLVEAVRARAVAVQYGQQCGFEYVCPARSQGIADIFPTPDVRQFVPLAVRALIAYDVRFPELQHVPAQVAERERGRLHVRGEHGGVRLQADAFILSGRQGDSLRFRGTVESDAG